MWYCWMTSSGINLVNEVIPPMFANRVQRIPTPSIADLMSVVDPKLVDVSIAKTALSMQPRITPILSTEAFYQTCVQITAAANMQLNLIALMEHKDKRGYVQGMVERIYSDNVVYTADVGQTYQSWFSERNLNLSTFSNDQLNLMYLDLVKQATGLNLVNSQSLASLQAAMVSMFERLSSYSIQFTSKINTSPIRNLNGPAIRVGDILGHGSTEVWLPDSTVNPRNRRAHGSDVIEFDLNHPAPREDYYFHVNILESVEIAARPQMGDHSWELSYSAPTAVRAHLANPPDVGTTGLAAIPGMDVWIALPESEKYRFVDMWGNSNYYYTPPVIEALDEAIANKTLNGLLWIAPST